MPRIDWPRSARAAVHPAGAFAARSDSVPMQEASMDVQSGSNRIPWAGLAGVAVVGAIAGLWILGRPMDTGPTPAAPPTAPVRTATVGGLSAAPSAEGTA